MAKENKSLSEQVKEAEKVPLKVGLESGNPVFWHRVIMSAVLALTGLILVFGVMLTYTNHQKAEEIQHQPVVGVVENTYLPAGDYFIFRVFLDAKNVNHYIVSSMDGGVLVAVAAPDGTAEPDDILMAERADSASYKLRVNDEGKWLFMPTSAYKRLLLEQGKITEPAQNGQEAKNAASNNQQ